MSSLLTTTAGFGMLGLLAQSARRINPQAALGAFLYGVAFFLGATGEAKGDGPPISFSLSLSVGRSPTALVVTDLNRDGRSDLAVANSESDSVSLLFGTGPGNFLPAIAVPSVAGPSALVSPDIDLDQRPDLVVASGFDDLLVSFNSVGVRSVEKFDEFPTGTGPAGLTSPDLNRDGRTDLVVSNSFEGTISIFFGGAAGFEPIGDLVTGGGFDSGPLGVSTGDIDGDGNADVAVANQMEDTVTLFLGDGSGAFPIVRTFEVDSLPTAVRMADATGDGLTDLVAVNEGSDSVVILVGDGAGGVSDRITLETGGFPESLAVRDLNGDGAADLVTADSFSDVVSVFAAQGDGLFAPRITFPVGRSPFDLAIGDFNADGRPDLATANLDDDTVSILLNTTPYSVSHGDADGDAALTPADQGAMLRELFDGDGDLLANLEGGAHHGAATSDANRDGFVTCADLLQLAREYARDERINRRARLTSEALRF